MIPQSEIDKIVSIYGLTRYLRTTGTSYIIRLEKNALSITVTVPLTAYEIFLDAKGSAGVRVSDWWDFYEEDRDQVYLNALDDFFSTLVQASLRISSTQRSVERGFNGRWTYFFGRYEE